MTEKFKVGDVVSFNDGEYDIRGLVVGICAKGHYGVATRDKPDSGGYSLGVIADPSIFTKLEMPLEEVESLRKETFLFGCSAALAKILGGPDNKDVAQHIDYDYVSKGNDQDPIMVLNVCMDKVMPKEEDIGDPIEFITNQMNDLSKVKITNPEHLN